MNPLYEGSMKNTFIVIAHRGASGYEPENTLRSFKRALEMGAQAIELDVHQLATGELVVIHDDMLDRTTKVSGRLCDYTYEQLRKINVGEGEHIPLLSEVLDLVDKKAIINIELKGPHTARPIAQLIQYYVKQKRWSHKEFIVSSFDHAAVLAFHLACPDVPVGFLFFGNKQDLERAFKANIDYIIVSEDMVNQKMVQETHAANKKILVYTIDNKNRALELQALGVDGIFSDYPDILSK